MIQKHRDQIDDFTFDFSADLFGDPIASADATVHEILPNLHRVDRTDEFLAAPPSVASPLVTVRLIAALDGEQQATYGPGARTLYELVIRATTAAGRVIPAAHHLRVYAQGVTGHA